MPSPELRRSSPPDYASRSGRWRLFVLVAALMFVLVAMNEARKPATWAWMWKVQRPTTSSERIDTRLDPATAAAAFDEEDPRGRVSPRRAPQSNEKLSLDAGAGVSERLGHEWSQIWESLDYREKGHLSRLVRTARRDAQATEADVTSWKLLAAELDQAWNELFDKQGRDLLVPNREVPADAKQTALKSLADLELTWNKRWKPAIEAAAAPRVWTAEERAALVELQSVFDDLAIAEVRDDTAWRAGDTVAWFRLVEQLRDSDPATIAKQSLGKVGFLQIFRQSAEYRGKVVTIRGTARLVYRVVAPKNDLGIQEYCLFWIQPEDGSNHPVVVYALNAPEGFPAISSEQQKIREEVEVTGYFFKRWVYRAADGLNSVPLLVAKSPQWFPPRPPAKTTTEQFADWLGPFFWPVAIAAVVCFAVVGWAVAWLANWSSRPSAGLMELRAKAEIAAADPATWKKLPATQSIEESLRNME